VRGSSDAIDIEEECGAGRNGLDKHRCGSANERRHAQQITSAYVPHCDLAAVTHIHVDTKQPLENDGQSFRVSFRVHGLARCKLDNASTVDQRLNRSNRQGGPTSAPQQTHDVDRGKFPARLIWRPCHLARVEQDSWKSAL